jgi:cytochrome P450
VTETTVEYNPFSPESQYDPYPCWRRLRDDAPVYFNPDMKFYALSRYDDVLTAFLDPQTYISGEGVTVDGTDRGLGSLIQLDPPDHTVYRKLLSRVFTPRRVGELEPFIRSVAGRYLDAAREPGRFDVVQDFSLRLPMEVISELLGLPIELRETVHDLSNRAVARDPDGPVEDVLEALGQMNALFLELVLNRRKHPRDDIISMLVGAEVTDEDGNAQHLSDEGIAAQFMLLASAGHETVMNLIGNGTVALCWYADQRAELVDNPSLISGAVEEMLRWDNPAPLEGRWCTRDVALYGTIIPAESRVLLLQGSANHDERQYDDPELFDIHRVIERPVVFGFGIHLCLGASLARLEGRIAFEELLARFPNYEIDETGVVREPASIFRGLHHLPVVTNR